MEYGMHPLDPTDEYNPDDYPAPPTPPSTDLGEVLFSICAAVGIMLAMWFLDAGAVMGKVTDSEVLTLVDLHTMARDIQDRMEGLDTPWTLDVHVGQKGLRTWGAVTFEFAPPNRYHMGPLGAARVRLPRTRARPRLQHRPVEARQLPHQQRLDAGSDPGAHQPRLPRRGVPRPEGGRVNAQPHLPPSHEDILTALKRYGPLTKGDASRRSGYAMSTTHDAMRRLQRFGLVEVVMTVQGDARGRTRNVYGLVGVHRRLRSRRTFILELVETLRAVTTQELAAHVGINPKTADVHQGVPGGGHHPAGGLGVPPHRRPPGAAVGCRGAPQKSGGALPSPSRAGGGRRGCVP